MLLICQHALCVPIALLRLASSEDARSWNRAGVGLDAPGLLWITPGATGVGEGAGKFRKSLGAYGGRPSRCDDGQPRPPSLGGAISNVNTFSMGSTWMPAFLHARAPPPAWRVARAALAGLGGRSRQDHLCASEREPYPDSDDPAGAPVGGGAASACRGKAVTRSRSLGPLVAGLRAGSRNTVFDSEAGPMRVIFIPGNICANVYTGHKYQQIGNTCTG